MYTHDLAGNFTSLNKAAERITGYSREEALRMNFAEVIAPEDLDKARKMVQRKVAENVATTYEIEVITKHNEPGSRWKSAPGSFTRTERR